MLSRVATEPEAEIYCRMDSVINSLVETLQSRQRFIRQWANMSPSDSTNKCTDSQGCAFYAISVKNAVVEKLLAYPHDWDLLVSKDAEECLQMRNQIESELRALFRVSL